MKSRSQESIPSTWSGGMQLMRSAATPMSSKRRAARPNRSPSGPPQCWPKTPQRPWRQRRKLSHTGKPAATSVSTASKVVSRISDIVSSSSRSGGSSSKARVSSSSRSSPCSSATSPWRLKATAQSFERPTSAVAWRASRMPRRASSIQSAGGDPAGPRSPFIASWMPQVLVEMTLQPSSA